MSRDRVGAVFKMLRYKLEGRWFDDRNRMAASMDQRTHHRTFRPHKINAVCCHTRNNTDQRTFGCNSSHHYNVLRAMQGNRYTIASTDCLRGGSSDMDLDKNQDTGNTTHTPQTHTRGVDPTPDFPSLAPPKSRRR